MFLEQVIARDVLRTAAGVLDSARAAGADVIYTRVAFAPDYSDMHANSALLAGTLAAQCLQEGTPGADIAAEVAPSGGDLVLTHQRIGAFAGTDLEQILRDRGINTLLLLGVATNASVETNARWASDLGFNVVLVEDACSATTLEAHAASAASLGMMATIASSADVIAALETAVLEDAK